MLKSLGLDSGDGGAGASFMKEFMGSVPGIDEATSFGEVIKSLDTYKFDLVISVSYTHLTLPTKRIV